MSKKIDLTKTKISEIDFTQIDYEQSYILHKRKKYKISTISELEWAQGRYVIVLKDSIRYGWTITDIYITYNGQPSVEKWLFLYRKEAK